MPKFTDTENETIKKLLAEKGKELFIEYGLKKTSIDEIVLACNIGKGSFYKFYSSKEELYFEILMEEEKAYQSVAYSVISSGKTGPELMTSLIRELCFFYTSNVFLQLFFERKEISLLLRKIPLKDIQAYSNEQRLLFVRAMETLQKEKRIASIKPEIIEGIVRGVLILSAHKQEIGENIYKDVMNSIIQFVGIGLGK